MAEQGRPGMLLVLFLVSLAGCGRRTDVGPPAPPPWFEDVTARCGLSFLHDAGPLDGRYFLPQIVGSGVALLDCDGDGRLDLYLIHNGGPRGRKNQLFRQQPDGTFQDVSPGSGLDVAGFGMGAAVGDIDNDGRPDLLLTEVGGVRLFRNEGDGRFRDVTVSAGLSNPHWATSAAFVDHDRDGWLDLVVVNYLDYDPSLTCRRAGGQPDYCNPMLFAGTPTRLFRNIGKGRFEDRTLSSGLAARPGPGLGVVCADLDGDGWPDILVANDGRPNHLWINQKDGTFREEAVVRGLAVNAMGQAQAGMGVAVADVDGNGLLDVLITHLTEETHTLWRQGPPGLFRDETAASGLALGHSRSTGFGVVLADLDHDAFCDLVIVNGRVARGRPLPAADLPPFWHPYAERNLLLAGTGSRFTDISAGTPALCGWPGVSRAVAVGDLDNDGALDLVVTTVAGPARLLRNVAPRKGHWLMLRTLDPALKRDTPGAVFTVHSGGRQWVGVVQPGQGYLSSHDPRSHLGLGTATRIDSVEVRWPDGLCERFPGGAVDRQITLRRGEGTVKP